MRECQTQLGKYDAFFMIHTNNKIGKNSNFYVWNCFLTVTDSNQIYYLKKIYFFARSECDFLSFA